MDNERRKYKRKLVGAKVKIFHPVIGAFESVTIDISNGGIRIPADPNTAGIKMHDAVKVVFLNSGDVAIIFNMNIVRNNEDGVGMELLSCEKNGKVFDITDLRDALS